MKRYRIVVLGLSAHSIVQWYEYNVAMEEDFDA